ncbi:hypothetical protein U9M48_001979 [Paspalum notatum var. saurae]|uniref:DUF4218 domain-containing protein n=1 Tax=Paspalum notatum var. saurae TaxID=547442 RepID=A0AAQ3PK86_PASNO
MVKELFNPEDEASATKSMFAALLEEMKHELYPGATYTRFSFVVKLLHIKSFYRISNIAFNAILKLISSAFPKCSILASYQEAKKLICALGLGYDSIHVCPNNCVLFRKAHEKLDKCPVCGASRWKDTNGRKKIPAKVEENFSSKRISELAQWHKLKRKAVENELSHPADGKAWKEFDRKYQWFAEDARNIRLGLATDGFNPFGKMSSSYSMWNSKDFNGKIEKRDKPEEFSLEELMQQLEKVKDVRPGKHPENRKRKPEGDDGQCWKRRSCLWDLPYWSSLKLRHNLDVMHIEKNICDYIFGTFLGISGKTKDAINSRLDLEDMGIRKNLHLKRDGNSYSVPQAPYVMNKAQKISFCGFLGSVKFPDGYASNLSTCVSVDGCNLQEYYPLAVRGIMRKDIYEAIAELGNFFQQLCAKTIKVDVMHRMKEQIPIILCKLEKIFPPSFFDVMLHLTVHLPDEAILRGPIQYGWMYPVERRLYTLKRFVTNMARPEGSIAEAYVANECLTSCSRYFDDLDTRHNREGRNKERVDIVKGNPTKEDCNDQSSAMIDRWSRGRSVGRDLDRITKGLNSKIPVVVSEGKKRPDAPMQAAKLASESGIILRQNVPIFPHWKEYKKESAKEIVENYMIKVACLKFDFKLIWTLQIFLKS